MSENKVYTLGKLPPKDFPREKRETEILRIKEALNSGKRLIILSGERQAGKSSLGQFVISEHCNEIDKTGAWVNLEGVLDYQDFLLTLSDELFDEEVDSSTPHEELETVLLKKIRSLPKGLLLGIDETAVLVSEEFALGTSEGRHPILNFLRVIKEAEPTSSFIFVGTAGNIEAMQDALITPLFTEEEIVNIDLRPIPQKERPYITLSGPVETF